jgi:hypothetical protein
MFLFFYIILLNRSENYESNGTGFIIFGALEFRYKFLKFEFSLKPNEKIEKDFFQFSGHQAEIGTGSRLTVAFTARIMQCAACLARTGGLLTRPTSQQGRPGRSARSASGARARLARQSAMRAQHSTMARPPASAHWPDDGKVLPHGIVTIPRTSSARKGEQ